ncbi:MAG: polysaccharide deacetylase [Rariglobus sp.]|nr:polysaccharide deacetylase [Rariglobus sp.]
MLPLVNGSFEDGLAGWTLKGGQPEMAVVDETAASLGKKGLNIRDASEARWQLVSDALPAKAGAVYALTYWGRSTGEPGAINVSIAFLDAAGQVLKGGTIPRYWPGVPVKTQGVWFGKAVAKSVAPDGTQSVVVSIAPILRKPRAAFIDDLRMVEEIEGEVLPPRVDAWLAEIKADPTRGAPSPAVVVKLDDLGDRRGKVHDRWQRVVDFAHERGIKIDLGVVANSLEGDKPAYFQWIKDQRATGRVGFWWHGWDHAEWKEGEKRLFEFGGTSYEHQRKHLEDSQRLAREKLGFPFVAFGAPFNVTDATTVRVLGEDKELRVWMYGPPDATADKIVLGRAFAVNIEQPTFVANYPEFIEGYAHNRGAGYFVIQGHPMQWNDERFDHFTRIIDFLIGQRAEFVFAEEFASRPELAGRAAR